MKFKIWFNNLKNEEKSDVSILRRVLAYLFDWYIGGVFVSIPIFIMYQLFVKKDIVLSNTLFILPKEQAFIAGIISIFLAFFYYTVIPYHFWNGQTLGKKIAKIRIVNIDYSPLSFKTLFMRQMIFMLLIEGRVLMPSLFIHELVSLIVGYNLVFIFSYIGYTITILSVCFALQLESRRSLHDVLSGTKVMMDSKLLKKKCTKKL
ncbi:MAG: RDD family protein [Erysipelotrichales bacterium]